MTETSLDYLHHELSKKAKKLWLDNPDLAPKQAAWLAMWEVARQDPHHHLRGVGDDAE